MSQRIEIGLIDLSAVECLRRHGYRPTPEAGEDGITRYRLRIDHAGIALLRQLNRDCRDRDPWTYEDASARLDALQCALENHS